MMAASSLISELRGSLNDESSRIQREFESSGDGRAAVAERTRLAEDILFRLWHDIISSDDAKPANFALVATGGFGRGWLFPYSDIDLLFLFGDRDAEQAILNAARTGKIGDGKIFRSRIDEAIRIRNDERGEGAL